MHFLEVAEPVQAAFAAFDQSMVVGVAFADVEFAANHVIARARVAGDVDAFDIDFRAVVDGEGERDLVRRFVALAVRPHVREGVTQPRQLARDRIDRLFHGAGVIDVAGVQRDELFEHLVVDPGDARGHGSAGDAVLRALHPS